MNKKDKEQILIVVFILAFILISIAFIVGTKIIPVKWIVVAVLALQCLYLVPSIVKMYYEANGYQIGFTRFIPFWNQISIFPSKIALSTLITLIGTALAVGCIFIPATIRANLFGEHFALNSGIYAIRLGAVFFIAYNIFVGVGYSHVFRDIKNMLAELSKSFVKTSKVEYVCYFLLFLPIIRGAGLSMFLDKLNKLVNLNHYQMNHTKNVLQEEN